MDSFRQQSGKMAGRRRFLAGVCAAVMGSAIILGMSNQAQALETVSLRLKWLTQAQFAGFYVAKAKGFYEEAGLDLTINPGGPNLTFRARRSRRGSPARSTPCAPCWRPPV